MKTTTTITEISLKVTAIQGSDGEPIYIQYDEEDSDELQAVGVSDVVDDIQERTERMKAVITSTVRGYSQTILTSISLDSFTPTYLG